MKIIPGLEGLRSAIAYAGSVTALASLLGVRQTTVSNWKARGVPLLRAPNIETVTEGVVTCHDLFPDLFRPRFPTRMRGRRRSKPRRAA